MNQKRSTYSQAVKNSLAAYKARDLPLARKWAVYAAKTSPEKEAPWLILGALSDLPESIEYYKRALEINPASQRARKGISQAIKKFRTLEKQPESQSLPTQLTMAAPPASMVQKQSSKFVWFSAALLVAVLAMALWGGLFSLRSIAASAHLVPTETAPLQLAVRGNQLTNTPTPTFTPTSTPTQTPSPTPTSSPTPTATRTLKPTATQEPPEVSNPAVPPEDIGKNEFWVEVNLTTQMLIAHRGEKTLRTFSVSTGTWRTPTVVGHYQVYVKYEATTMSGPGYYLPDVPYTMYFYKGYGIHGTYWHNNFGTPMSHGCVNMKTSDAEWVFQNSYIGTWVVVHY
jgi:lipoprotein-anchoring transpeptidase ErfK/SrfK